MRLVLQPGARRDVGVAIFFSALFVGFFGPVLFGHRYLTTGGDGLTMALPAYLRVPTLWEPNIMLGYPWSANLDGFWDPIALVLRRIPQTFNLFMLAAYVIAAFGTYRLVLTTTGSRLGGMISGITYALGGFMISHLGHYDIVHPAAWTPWVLWAFTALRARIDTSRIAAGAFAIALTAVSGQPQVLTYTLLLSFAFVSVAGSNDKRARRYLAACALTVIGGLGLAAITLLPAAGLAQASVRVKITFDTFLAYSSPPHEIPIRLLFPYFLGLTQSRLYPFSAINFDAWNELSNYVGITTLMLAGVAAIGGFRNRLVLFWTAVAVVALALTAGDGFKLAAVTYHLPILSLFRAQGRHALEFTLAIAVLAGYGVAAIQQRRVTRGIVILAIALTGCGMGIVLVAIVLLDRPFAAEVVARTGWAAFPIDPLHNPALMIPVIVYVAGAGVIFAWSRRRSTRAAQFVLLAVVIADLSSFAWFGQWHDSVITAPDLAAPPYIATLRTALVRTHERVMVIPKAGSWAGLDPQLNLLWNLPLTGGHVQLEVAKTAALLHLDPDGVPSPELFEDARDRGPDICAIRFIVLPPGSLGIRPLAMPWDDADLNVRIGSPAWTATSWVPRADFSTHFARPLWVSRVLLVSSLSDASTIGDRARVADIVLTTVDGRRVTLPVAAGADTAERGYDRQNVRPLMHHARASIFENQGIDHDYVATFPLRRRERVTSVAVVWTGRDPARGYMNLDRLSFVDDVNGVAYPISPLTLLQIASDHWRAFAGAAPALVLENRRPLGRAWLVHHVVTATPQAALAVIRSGRFDPAKTAIGDGAPLRTTVGAREFVQITSLDAMHMALDARCASRCFVVTSDAADPGWEAAVDGSEVAVHRADYALRGVFVPAGTHRVTFSFRPRDTSLGAGITLVTALFLGAAMLPPLKRKLLHRLEDAEPSNLSPECLTAQFVSEGEWGDPASPRHRRWSGR
jgi:hypothetical protein